MEYLGYTARTAEAEIWAAGDGLIEDGSGDAGVTNVVLQIVCRQLKKERSCLSYNRTQRVTCTIAQTVLKVPLN